jgi:ABC-type multidrug transport system fused ATPase/permease subunit
MSRPRSVKSDIKYQLLLSFLGLFLVVLLTAFPPAVVGDVPWRKPVVGSIFNIICTLGISAVLLPNNCFGIINIEKKDRNVTADSTRPALHRKSNTLQGHHPTCGKYDAHVFRINGRTVCAACAGLLLGGLLAFAGAVAYFFGGWTVADNNLMALLGSVLVSFGLFQFKFRSLVRLLMNIVFVLGALLIVIGIDGLVSSLIFDLFVVSLVLFWLYTRISLSQWDHELICSSCEVENCNVRE